MLKRMLLIILLLQEWRNCQEMSRQFSNVGFRVERRKDVTGVRGRPSTQPTGGYAADGIEGGDEEDALAVRPGSGVDTAQFD